MNNCFLCRLQASFLSAKKTASAEAEAVDLDDITRRSGLAAIRKRDAHADKPPRSPTHV